MLIDYKQAVQMAEREVAGKEEFIYFNLASTGVKRCVYVLDEEPSCLVGRILINNYIASVEFFQAGSELGGYNDDAFEDIVPPLWHKFGVQFTDKAEKFLKILQSRQDSGDSWGVSLEHAKDYMEKWDSSDD